MTANLESHGLDDSVELGVLLDATRTAGVASILRAWTGNAPFELRPAPKLGDVLGNAEVWVEVEKKKRLVPFQVTRSATRTLGPMVAASADRLESDPMVPRGASGLPVPAHEMVATWEITAPRLAPGSRAIDSGAGKGGRPTTPPCFARATAGSSSPSARATRSRGRGRSPGK